MFLVLFLFGALFRALQGHPISSPHLPNANYDAFVSREAGAENRLAMEHIALCVAGRSEWSIIRSCLVTILACTWKAIHPNIGAPEDSQWITFRRRLLVMVCALIAPEVMVLWAMKQRLGAKRIVRKFNREIAKVETPKESIFHFGFMREWFSPPVTEAMGGLLPWSMVQGFFLQMGGLLLCKDGQPYQTLDYERMKKHIAAGEIDIPCLNVAEIKDRSKGDFIVKGLVLLQTSGFIFQSIARLVEGLPLVELEVVTLAFAMLNAITYFLWWDKPQNVCLPIRIQLKKVEKGEKEDEHSDVQQDRHKTEPIDNEDSSTEESDHDQPSDALPGLYAYHTGPIMSSEETLVGDRSSQQEGSKQGSSTESIECNQKPSDVSSSAKTWKFWKRKTWEDYDGSRSTEWKGRIWYLAVRVPYRLAVFLCYPFSQMGGGAVLKDGEHRIPMFYAASETKDNVIGFAAVIATVFGLIHFLAWSTSFPSTTEKVLWRVTTFIITVQPGWFMLANLSKEPKIFKHCRWLDEFVMGMGKVGVPLYIIARLTLLVLAFLSLRDLPPAAHQTIQWKGLIPWHL